MVGANFLERRKVLAKLDLINSLIKTAMDYEPKLVSNEDW